MNRVISINRQADNLQLVQDLTTEAVDAIVTQPTAISSMGGCRGDRQARPKFRQSNAWAPTRPVSMPRLPTPGR
jgi:hypothetical protein